MPTPSEHRRIAESFGLDAERYDRTRPRYPAAVVERIVAALPGSPPPGPAVLDVGAGTGIAARQFAAAGCQVLGVDPDARMAELAARYGVIVEVATFEEWKPAGRTFDGVVAGQAWHWVDPVAGARQAARVLRPGGLLAVFWNAFRPTPEIAAAFSAVYRTAAPSLPFDPWAGPGDSTGFHDRAAEGIRQVAGFREPEQWACDWTHEYSRDAWLDLVPTAGGHNLLPPAELDALLSGLGAAIDGMGGTVVIPYRTVVTTARLTPPSTAGRTLGA